MNHVHRFVLMLPAALPVLALATWLDYMLAPVGHRLKGDPPTEIARVAWKMLGVE